MRKKTLWIAAIAVCLAMALCGCFAEKQVEPSVSSRSETAQPAGTDGGDALVEDWGDDPQDQTDAAPMETEPTVAQVETAPSSGAETVPSGENAATQPTVGTEETEPPDATEASTEELSYEAYLALSAAERQAYVESFPSMEEAMLWYESAKKAYEESQENIEITGGNVDLGDILDGMGE